MIRKIDTGEFELTTDNVSGEPYYVFNEARFKILKFRKRKIDKAPKGFSIKIEQTWRNGRTKTECLPFENFRDKYLRDHSPIFLEGGATLCFVLGVNQNEEFIPLKAIPVTGEPANLDTAIPMKVKDFKVRMYYDLYIA